MLLIVFCCNYHSYRLPQLLLYIKLPRAVESLYIHESTYAYMNIHVSVSTLRQIYVIYACNKIFIPEKLYSFLLQWLKAVNS